MGKFISHVSNQQRTKYINKSFKSVKKYRTNNLKMLKSFNRNFIRVSK